VKHKGAQREGDRYRGGLAGTRRLISRGYDERRQTSKRLGEPHERVSEKLIRRQSPVDVHLQTVVKEVLKHRREFVPLFDVRLAVSCDEIERLQHSQQLVYIISNAPVIFSSFSHSKLLRET